MTVTGGDVREAAAVSRFAWPKTAGAAGCGVAATASATRLARTKSALGAVMAQVTVVDGGLRGAAAVSPFAGPEAGGRGWPWCG